MDGAAVSTAHDDVKNRISAIEESYEFFLAYAAQGLTTDQGAKSGHQLREFLEQAASSLEGLPELLRSLVDEIGGGAEDSWNVLLGSLESDAAVALAAVRVVLARPGISSELIDNLNANIHLRALLTDLFLMDDLIDAA